MKSSASDNRFQNLENTFKSHKHYFTSLRRNFHKNDPTWAASKTTESMTNNSLHQNKSLDMLRTHQSDFSRTKYTETSRNAHHSKEKLNQIIKDTTNVVVGIIPEI